eukprot:scaffold42194_cov35-Tisochrysis_lutea.AAC.2
MLYLSEVGLPEGLAASHPVGLVRIGLHSRGSANMAAVERPRSQTRWYRQRMTSPVANWKCCHFAAHPVWRRCIADWRGGVAHAERALAFPPRRTTIGALAPLSRQPAIDALRVEDMAAREAP